MEMREALLAVQELLEDEAPTVRLAATNVLVRLGNKSHITFLNRRLNDSNPEVRLCAASALARLGVRAVCPGILDQALDVRGLNSLNALRQPDLWQKLANTSLAGDLEGSRPEMIRQIAKQVGVVVHLSESFMEQESSPQKLRPILSRSNRT
jgi:HEAT repeat protein